MKRSVKLRDCSVRALATTCLLSAACSAGAPLASVTQAIDINPALVIRQIYGGAGGADALLAHDFVELFNRSQQEVSLAGLSLQYASATGTGAFGASTAQLTELPDVTLAPGHSFLVQQGAGKVGTALPTPDSVDDTPIAMSASNGKVALVRRTTSLACNGGSTPCTPEAIAEIIDLVGYGKANFFEGSAGASAANSAVSVLRAGQGCSDTNDNSADFALSTPAPRTRASEAIDCTNIPTDPVPGDDAGPAPTPEPGVAARIHEIQGLAHRSPLESKRVRVNTAIVTAMRSNGFYMQEAEPDADDSTSEGILVFTGAAPKVAIGDSVDVTGDVVEYRPGCNNCAPSSSSYANLTTTELSNVTVRVLASDQLLPAPIRIGRRGRAIPNRVIEDDVAGDVELDATGFDPRRDGLDFYESLEGMRVEIQDAHAVSPTMTFGGSQELVVVTDRGAEASLMTARGGIVISGQDYNPERIFLSSELGVALPTANVGDELLGTTTGVLDYSFANYKVLATSLPALTASSKAREVSSLGRARANQLTAASFNVENLDPSDPDTLFSALATYVVDHLGSPDLLALEEVQDNNGKTNDAVVAASETLAKLKAAIVAAGGPDYLHTGIDPEDDKDGGEPGGNIRVVFLYRTDRGLSLVERPGASFDTANSVRKTGRKPSLTYSPGRIDPLNAAFANSRKPLAVEFDFRGNTVFVIGNHWNSKGGDEPLFGRFQPPTLGSEVQRLAQAQIVAGFVQQITAVDRRAFVLLMGDLNDFEFSPPLATLKGIGMTPLMETLPKRERYTYVYQGNSQALDHMVASAGARAVLQGFDVVHLNAERADQVSDHDPLVARFGFGRCR
jgi:predicted extracellular nuclease